MRSFTFFGLLLSLVYREAIAIPTPSAAPSATAVLSTRDSTSTACGAIVNNQDTTIFNASFAFECLTSVPFNPAVATRFVQYYNDTLQFQSTLTYLKDPPASYQQPGVDLIAGLNQLQGAINGGLFSNQYEFEAALQTLLYATHDGHVDLLAGVLSAFSFASPRDIVSLSLDGQQIPKVYLADDLFESNFFTIFQPSAIASINGKDAATYLLEFASLNSQGTLESNSDWNQLMLSAAQDIQGYFNVFSGGATFYPGDSISFILENGTNITESFLATYDSPGPTGPLETGGDFYNFFVLGFYPASYDPDEDDFSDDSTDDSSDDSTDYLLDDPTDLFSGDLTDGSSDDSTDDSSILTGWDNLAYPTVPNIAQPDLDSFGDGYVSGYFLNDSSISVLSIPSFDVSDDSVITFQETITQFINQTQAAGLKKIVIDLQQNYGGQSLLAIDTFKQFFPNIDPFAGSRMRAHASANVLGEILTNFWNGLDENDETKYSLTADEWVITDRINADTERNFTNWAEFFGPQLHDGDNYTNIERYNISSAIFDAAGADLDVDDTPFAVYGTAANPAPANAVPPFAAEDIMILSDGICHSACALLIEMFRHEAGVKVVAVGGTTSTGPMQAPAGSRGALDYSTDTLDANIDFTQQLLQEQNSPDATFLPNRTTQLSMFVYFADINLRDQIRKNETIPLQFAYEAADCRIYYTPQTIYNYTNLWQYAADANWKNSSLCVKDSTGYSPTSSNTTEFVGPPASTPGKPMNLTNYLNSLTTSPIANIILQGLSAGLPASDESLSRNSPASKKVVKCTEDTDCKSGQLCVPVTPCKGNSTVAPAAKQCVDTCPAVGRKCARTDTICSSVKSIGSLKVGSKDLKKRFCPPTGSNTVCGAKVKLSETSVGNCANCAK